MQLFLRFLLVIIIALSQNIAAKKPRNGGYDRLMTTWADICKDKKDAVVQIFTYRSHLDIFEPFRPPEQSTVFGSGVIISDDGYLLTNFHVVENAIGIYAQTPLSGKERFRLEYIGGCPQRDVCLLRFSEESLNRYKKITNRTEMPAVELGDSDKIVEAQAIMLLGHPGGEEEVKITIGYVKGRTVNSSGALIETTAPANHGDSGGPFFDENGLVIGLCVAGKVGSECFNYIIPTNNILLMLRDLNENLILRLPFWGILFIPTTASTRAYLKCPEEGVYLSDVIDEGLAKKVGLQVGDIITAVDNKSIDESGYLFVDWTDEKISIIDYVNRLAIDSEVSVTYYRNGAMNTTKLTLSSRQPNVVDHFYPCFEPSPEYEIFGGMVVSQLTLNHVLAMAQAGALEQALIRYTQDNGSLEPRLLITCIFNTSQLHLSRAFPRRVSLLNKINGQKVTTIAEFRDAVLAGKNQEFFTIETENGAFVALPLQEILKEEERLSQIYFYEKSSLVTELTK